MGAPRRDAVLVPLLNPSNGPLTREGLGARVAPFAAGAAASLVLVALPAEHSRPGFQLAAMLLTLAIVAVTLLVPWDRAPRAWQVVVPLAYFGVIWALQHGQGGPSSGFIPLVLLPLLWLGLFGRPWEITLGLVATMAVILGPTIAGHPQYPVMEWRRGLLWLGVGAVAGFVVRFLVTRLQEHITERQRVSDEMIATNAMLAAVGAATRAITAGGDARTSICDAVIDVSGADLVQLWEPRTPDVIYPTASAGLELPYVEVTVGKEPSGAALAMATGSTLFVEDARNDPNVSAKIVELAGVRSVLFEPIVDGAGEVLGVLIAAWKKTKRRIESREIVAIGLLAHDAAVAIEREDMMQKLEQMATTDHLTGVANRRTFEELLDREMARAFRYRSGLCVGIVDLDDFKAFNDSNGHVAGDRLLKSAAAGWSATLRETDTLARYGGEEFVIVFPESSLDEAVLAIQRLRRVDLMGETFSAGVAEWDGTESGDALLRRADRALYDAKGAGKNRSVAARP